MTHVYFRISPTPYHPLFPPTKHSVPVLEAVSSNANNNNNNNNPSALLTTSTSSSFDKEVSSSVAVDKTSALSQQGGSAATESLTISAANGKRVLGRKSFSLLSAVAVVVTTTFTLMASLSTFDCIVSR